MYLLMVKSLRPRFVIVATLLAATLSLIIASTAHAGVYSAPEVQARVKTTGMVLSFANCASHWPVSFDVNMLNPASQIGSTYQKLVVSGSTLHSGRIFQSIPDVAELLNPHGVGFISQPDDGNILCIEVGLDATILSQDFGWSTTESLFCEGGWVTLDGSARPYVLQIPGTPGSCEEARGTYLFINKGVGDTITRFKNKAAATNKAAWDGVYDASMQYVSAFASFTAANGCGGSVVAAMPTDAYGAARTFATKIVDSQGVITDGYIQLGSGKDQGTNVPYILDLNANNITKSCKDLATEMTNASGAYGLYVQAHKGTKDQESTDGKLVAEGDNSTTTCTVEGIGWIVCPVMNFMAGVNDVLYGALQTMLKVNPMIFTGDTNTDSTSDLYAAWNTFRGIANILFIVVFLIIIYSQITSVGITNYGLKKLLPKLVIAAVLVNVSFYICQIAVDIANILGFGLKSLFTSIGAGIGSQASAETWVSVVGQGIAYTGMAAGTVALLLAVSVPTLLAGLLALLMVVIILIVRQAIIILLIAISPLAFVAWLLPNTEKWFKKWWELFFSMLMLFPVISALFGAGALAARILGTSNFGEDNGVAKLAALGAAVLPLVATIPLLQGALKATGALGAKLSGWSGKANARVGSKVKGESMLGKAWTGGMANRTSRRTSFQNKALSKGPMKYVAGALGGKGYAATLADRATAIEDKEHHEAVERATTGLVGKSDAEILAQAQDGKRSAAERQAAISHLLQKGSFGDKQKALEAASGLEDTRARTAIADEYAKSDMSSLYGKSLAATIRAPQKDKDGKTKPPLDLASTLRGNYGNVSAQTLAGNKDYAEAVKKSSVEATDEQKEHLMNTLNQIDSNPNINPTSETQGHLDELTDIITRPPTTPATQPPPAGTP
jgi:hypothetical protein